MKLFLTGLVGLALLAVAACESAGQYDGVTRFADLRGYGPYHGPGSPTRDGNPL